MSDIIYIRLLDEGTKVWRPVEAIHRYENVYMIISENPNPDDEIWEFSRGDDVYCKRRTFDDGEIGLIAYAKAEKDNL